MELSFRCVENGYLANAENHWRHFMLMPMMHSEDIAVQDVSLPLFKKLNVESVYDYAVRHRDIVARFGRFPHRNSILGRSSTKEELKFLAQSRFLILNDKIDYGKMWNKMEEQSGRRGIVILDKCIEFCSNYINQLVRRGYSFRFGIRLFRILFSTKDQMSREALPGVIDTIEVISLAIVFWWVARGSGVLFYKILVS